VHAVVPVLAWYWPAEQLVQAALLAEAAKVPTEHAVYPVSPVPAQ
jgi:hypothetical protein